MGSRRFLVVSSSLLPSLSFLSLSLFLRKCPAVKNTHENTQTHTKTRRQRVYTRTLHLCSPARGAFESKSRIHIFLVSPFFFLYREKKGNMNNKIRILFTKIVSPVVRICNAAATVARGRGRWFVKPWSVRGR